MSGLKNIQMNSRIKAAAKRDHVREAATALRAQYGFGDEAARAQLAEILSGETKLRQGKETEGRRRR